ncbi:MAG TPA: Gfo/Idh/MocA family oxidoreductase [Rhodospirillales bacterium]|nr:Gfo/Idh/MocA family oxidoreductase [Rhodospirillales bacterium]HIC59530.1 Gfo/Idh/MocA family oxidoreductase [Rhodospirillales bacterium]HIM20024.1 Gfo/Idh/MocA family oxidoreductase [Rhodospirillales bacterium]HIN75673.1 Gfo/Idh/MocA family oxidoreductase [Rhodospirillales bacterium]HIP08919.1 Gfo/Idh/MocA family oxidoreductase [Rhodospirillales bacterium]
MKNIGVAVIGLGGIGTLRAHSCAQIPQVGHLAICDIDPGKLDKLSETVKADIVTENYEEAINDERIQSVIVSTDEESHYGPAKLAAELGKPVLIEKPFVLNLDEADDIIATAKQNGSPAFVGYTQRFRKRYLLAKESVEAGHLGDVVMAFGKIYVTRAVGEAVARRSPNTTPSINTLTYMVDLILWYMEGKTPVEVYARSASKVFKPYNRDDFQWMIVTFDDGSVATLGTSWLPPHHWPAYTATMEIDLQGTGGSLNIDDSHRDFVLASAEPIPCPYTPEHEVKVAFLGSAMPGDFALGEFFGPMKEETDSFIRYTLQMGGVGLATAEHARDVLALTMAADRSCKENKPIRI